MFGYLEQLHLHFLGAPQFKLGGEPVDLTAAKPIAVLTYLAVTRASHPREHVLDLLWTESAVESGRKNLRNALWTLRKTLGDDVLRTSGEYLTLSDNIWTDVRALEQAAESQSSTTLDDLQSAVDLYRGPLADGLVLDFAPEFELWLTAERERLANLYLQVLDTLIEAHRTAGDWTGVIALARQGLKHHPWQESLYQALIEAHARRGERSEALKQFEALRLVLDRELGIEPLPETQTLRDAVKRGMNVSSTSSVLRTPSFERKPQSAGGVPFVDRTDERAMLDIELEAASTGQARVVLLTGELGIGKSRLWAEWSGKMGAGVTVLETGCLATTQAVPLAPLAELFSDVRSGAALGPGPHAFPFTSGLAPFRGGTEGSPGGLELQLAAQPSDRLATFEAYVQYLVSLGARPLVIFIDDLHWADDTTLEWLGYLVHRLRDYPLLLVGAYQPQGVSAMLVRLVTGWLREGVVGYLPLQRLGEHDSSTLIASCGCPPSVAEGIMSLGLGNPYFLIELCKGALNSSPADSTPVVPAALAELIRARLVRLPQVAGEVARAAAVLPPSFRFSALWQISGRGEVDAVDALDILLQAGVLQEDNGFYSFAHPLVRAVVRSGLSEARRDLLSRRLAVALDATQGIYSPLTTVSDLGLALSYASAGGLLAQA
jgi:DNA-binding SARP family transcriptional activator